jgi:hypothetical protein
MRKGLFAICLSLVVAIVLLAAFVPSCTPTTPTTGTIQVKATLCGDPWPTQGTGAVNYTLTPASGSAINGTTVPKSFTVDPGSWSCAYVSGGPPGAYFVDITPSATQSLSEGGTITFTLNFELNQDAAITFLHWSQNGVPLVQQPSEIIAVPCNIIDAHFLQWVLGCEGYNVTMSETSKLMITQTGGPGGVVVYVVGNPCAVNKTPPPQGLPPVKKSQYVSFNEGPVLPGQYWPIPPPEAELPALLDVETTWELVKCVNYTKAINWFGISVGAYEPGLHPCVLFELILPLAQCIYTFTIQTSADVALVGATDVDLGNNHDMSAPITLIVNS